MHGHSRTSGLHSHATDEGLMTTDTLIHIPEPMPIPAVGEIVTDKLSDMEFVRLTDAASIGAPLAMTRYTTMSPFSCDKSKIIILEESTCALYDVVTGARICTLPFGDDGEGLWDNTDPNLIWYHKQNLLWRYDVSTGLGAVVREFKEYSSISGMGESSLSEDGNHLVLCGDGKEIFLYEISSGDKSLVCDSPDRLDSLYCTPDNNVLISVAKIVIDGKLIQPAWMRLYNPGFATAKAGEWGYVPIGKNNGHKAVTRDTDGSEVLVWIDDTNNAITKIRLSDGQESILLKLEWRIAVHITASRQGTVLVSSYSDGPNVSTPYEKEVFQIPLSPSEPPIRLVHTRSTPTSYEAQAWAALSNDGCIFAFNSNWGTPVVDVYLVRMAQPTLQPLGPTTAQMTEQAGADALAAAEQLCD